MKQKHISIYLNDHLAGSGLGIELSTTLAQRSQGTEASSVLLKIKQEFTDEREQLRLLMQKLGIEESNIRKVGAWLNAKLLETKLGMENFGQGQFFLFEGLEVLSTGIAGKHLMWVVLANLSEKSPIYQQLNYSSLIEQAISQRERVEALRIQFAHQTFLPPHDSK